MEYEFDDGSSKIMLELSLHIWNEVALIIMNDLFDMILNSYCKNFIENVRTYVHQGD